MKWSKLKQRVEENFAPELAGRVNVRLTRYRRSHDQEQHGRIYIDGEVWFDACTFKTAIESLDTAERTTGIASWGIVHGDYGVEEDVKSRGFLEGYFFPKVLFSFLNTSIDNALKSDEPLMRILAVMDRRVGKRRLDKLLTCCPGNAPERKFIEMRLPPRQMATSIDTESVGT
ncbi:hypothetical protein [uncultured Litoreibacter sp.]|uniref:SF0329 family protein n=1 Tax=uncultured Litoreibacter sp. TaxID=1392394 RepID=UPI00261101A7|nr:hypothetical protein [uncultured Litoreibacter sp.]